MVADISRSLLNGQKSVKRGLPLNPVEGFGFRAEGLGTLVLFR